ASKPFRGCTPHSSGIGRSGAPLFVSFCDAGVTVRRCRVAPGPGRADSLGKTGGWRPGGASEAMSRYAPRDRSPSGGGLQGSLDRRLLMSLLAGAAGAPGLAFAQPQSQPVQVPSGAPTHPGTQPPPTPETGTLIGKRDRSARMTTKVLINGQGPYDFVIDTGANRSVIATELAAQLQLPPGNPTRVHGIARVQDAQTVNVKSLRAGAVEAPIEDVPLLARVDLDADGILGIDAFADRQVTFDFVTNVVRINRATFEHGFTERP